MSDTHLALNQQMFDSPFESLWQCVLMPHDKAHQYAVNQVDNVLDLLIVIHSVNNERIHTG